MPEITNLTNITGVQSLNDVALFADFFSGGLFFAVAVLCIFLIILVNNRAHGIDKAMAAACFACLILSGFLLYLGLINMLFPIMFAIGLGGTLFYVHWSNR